jgi:hypothetical protein
MDWLNDQTNGRGVRWWTELTGDHTRERAYERDKRLFRRFMPGWMILIGLFWLLWGMGLMPSS